MTVSRSTSWPAELPPDLDLAAGGIDASSAERQRATAQEILRRFCALPGVVLADEVGMGKTFVALAVATAVTGASKQPAVILVPPRLLAKWERDLRRFRNACLGQCKSEANERLRYRVATSGAEFLRCFDDDPAVRARIVLLSTSALTNATERDPLVRWAVIRAALEHSSKAPAIRRGLLRFGAELVRGTRHFDEHLLDALLDLPVDRWRAHLEQSGVALDDDPIPVALEHALPTLELDDLVRALERVPLRESAAIEERLQNVRQSLNSLFRTLWPAALHAARISSPLLVCDEAHHLKNPRTRLASLFAEKEAAEAASVLNGSFERMLFLTATPFQLGHHELLEVLRRFRAIDWSSFAEPATSLAHCDRVLEDLRAALDLAQGEALQLDTAWGRLRPADLGVASAEDLPAGWWRAAQTETAPSEALSLVREQYARTREAIRTAEQHLRPWVLRHVRARELHSEDGAVPRRSEWVGRGILDRSSTTRGLPLEGQARFPFLLGARAQAALACAGGKRAYFVEGLASSFSAFRETARGGRPEEDADVDEEDGHELDDEARWYVSAVRDLLDGMTLEHPKLDATARRALAHWRDGDKVLVFAHYRKTVRDLRERLERDIEQEIQQLATKSLALPTEAGGEALDRVRRISQRIQDRESPFRKAIHARLRGWLVEAEIRERFLERMLQLLLRVLATPSFVVRHLPLDRPEVRHSLEAHAPSTQEARAAADAVADSLSRRSRGKLSYRHRVESFLRHWREDLGTDEEREELLETLSKASQEVVRHADGEVPSETRQRLLAGFNSPLLPEILIASEVMSEGLDLHLDCRHVIHHDLSWNPSTLEQRTGRVDRLRCRAEVEGRSIEIYLPYLEGTSDEKMYRVVSDRARWFQVVMGERFELDESSTDRLAQRVPLPPEAAAELAMRLGVADLP